MLTPVCEQLSSKSECEILRGALSHAQILTDTMSLKKENINWVNIIYSQFSNIIHPTTLCHRCFYHHHHLTKIETCQVTQQWSGRAHVWTKVSWVQSSRCKHYTLQSFLLLGWFAGWAVSSECEARDIWCGTTRAVSCNKYSGCCFRVWDTPTPI